MILARYHSLIPSTVTTTKVMKNSDIGKAIQDFLTVSFVIEIFLISLLVSSTSSTEMNCYLS